MPAPETTPGNSREPDRARRTHRWVRQLHLWLGAWGALAAMIYGVTGLMMNHRFGDDAWPQGKSEETAKLELSIPETARSSAEALSLWLQQSNGLEAQIIRKPPPGEPLKGPQRWTLSGGSAGEAWSLDYKVGDATAELKRTKHDALAALNRLHKAVGGGWAWRLLADSFAVGMILLGISGIWMWSRGRSLKEMVVSVFTISTILLLYLLTVNLS